MKAFWRDWVSWLLIGLAIGCFVIGGFPQWSDWVDPANGDKVSEWRLGFWSSPVYQYVYRDRAQGGFNKHFGLDWFSWSSLIIVIGICSLEMCRWRRSAPGTPQAQDQGNS